jgi:hypothetical protein
MKNSSPREINSVRGIDISTHGDQVIITGQVDLIVILKPESILVRVNASAPMSPNSNDTQTLLLAAHMDSAQSSFGAYDDG